jgi:hypothetical protein
MSMTPEKKVKQKVAKQLKEIGAYFFYPATGGYGRSGVPDIVGCYKGMFFGIECKAGKNKLTALQERELGSIEKSAGIAMVVNEDNVTEIELQFKTQILDQKIVSWASDVAELVSK